MNKTFSTKKILSLLLALAMLLSTAACGRTDDTPQTSGQSPADASSQDPEASLTLPCLTPPRTRKRPCPGLPPRPRIILPPTAPLLPPNLPQELNSRNTRFNTRLP